MNSKRKKYIPWLIIGIVILILLVYCRYELHRSAESLTVNTFEFDSEKINESVRIVILGDLHNHDFGDRLAEKVKEQDPDMILMAGDMIDQEKEDEEQIFALISELKDTAPVYYAVGNHEVKYISRNPSYYDQLTQAGCIVIDKEYIDLDISGNRIRLGALYDYPFGMVDNYAESAPKEIQTFMKAFCDTDDLKLLIAHRPDSFVFGNVSKVYDIDIVISSHLHGGQVVVPFKGGLYGGDQGWFPEYVHGMYEKDKIHLLITSGLGSSSQKLPRFLNPPEIMVLELK